MHLLLIGYSDADERTSKIKLLFLLLRGISAFFFLQVPASLKTNAYCYPALTKKTLLFAEMKVL